MHLPGQGYSAGGGYPPPQSQFPYPQQQGPPLAGGYLPLPPLLPPGPPMQHAYPPPGQYLPLSSPYSQHQGGYPQPLPSPSHFDRNVRFGFFFFFFFRTCHTLLRKCRVLIIQYK